MNRNKFWQFLILGCFMFGCAYRDSSDVYGESVQYSSFEDGIEEWNAAKDIELSERVGKIEAKEIEYGISEDQEWNIYSSLLEERDDNGVSERASRAPKGLGKVVLVISPPIFEDSLQQWIEFRQKQGYKILYLPLVSKEKEEPTDDDVKLQPVVTPNEIRSKIRLAAEKYQIEAILLVGDGAPTESAKHGWRDVVPAPRVPALVIQVFGSEDLLASDSYYSDMDGDGIPDVPIGRLPVETPDELKMCIEKIICYETEIPVGNWTRKINLVTGPNGLDLRTIGSTPDENPVGDNPLGGISMLVTSIVDRFARKLFVDYLPQEFVLSLTQFSMQSPFCPYPADFETTTLQRMNEGSLFFVYIGHGRVFGLDRFIAPSGIDYGILELDDCKRLNTSSHPPIACFFACYTCAYDASWRSLGEELFLKKGGPIAVIGASRKTAPYGMCCLGASLLESAFGGVVSKDKMTNGNLTLGEVYLNAQRRTLVGDFDDKMINEDVVSVEPFFNDEQSDDFLDTGSQLDWINKRLNKSLKEANKRRNVSFRKSIDQVAMFFDPTASRLKDQLRDHIAEFNLLGDPLLRVKFPIRFSINAPDTTYSSGEIEITGFIPIDEGSEAIVQGELLLADFRTTIPKPKRSKKFIESTEAREEYNSTYCRANKFVVDAVRTRTKDGCFTIQIQVPEDYSGESIVRVAALSNGKYYISSKRLLVRPQASLIKQNHIL